MKNEIILGGVVSLVGFVVGYVLSESFRFGTCDANTNIIACRELLSRIGDPMFFGGIALLIVFSVLFFVPKAYKTWKKFAMWSLPLLVVAFIVYKDDGGNAFMDTSSPEVVFRDLSILYLVISLVVIAISHYKSRKQK